MPVFRSGRGSAPPWGEMEEFEIIDLQAGEEKTCRGRSPRQHFIGVGGRARVRWQATSVAVDAGDQLEVTVRTDVRLMAETLAQVFRAAGRWEHICSAGIFTVKPGAPPQGDTPHDYPKTTTFDNHYHDCDEYWVMLEGRATVATEGKLFEVGPGDAVATGCGWHHDVLRCHSEDGIRGIWFEGTLEGRKRVGHLWEPKHGRAVPMVDRV